MLNTILMFFSTLALKYVIFTSHEVFQVAFKAVSYHVFRCCYESGCISQNALSVLFAKILSKGQ